MKLVAELRKNLNKLNLSFARQADLISKYIYADTQLTRKMNSYFGVKKTAISKKVIVKKKSKPQNSPSKQKEKHSQLNKKAYHGSNAGIFDHRARPTPDLHLETDKLLDKEYFDK